MDFNRYKALYLSYDDIRATAKSFLKRYNPKDEFPLNIELIVESEFGINIIPVELERLLGISALTSVNQKEIRVDKNTLSNNNNRYRFSLSHELGHIVLHKNIFEKIEFKTLDDFIKIQDEIPSDEYGWLEWQANCFAGLYRV